MIPKRFNDWLQVLGLFGVLGGLIFVGLQLRLARQVAITEGTEAAVGNRYYWAELVNANSEIWVKGLAGEPLSPTELARFDALANGFTLSWFSSWQRAGQIRGVPPERRAWVYAAELHQHPGLRRWWQESRDQEDEHNQRLGRTGSSWNEMVETELGRLDREGPAK